MPKRRKRRRRRNGSTAQRGGVMDSPLIGKLCVLQGLLSWISE